MKFNSIFEKLVIFEMANNHMGDVGHGLQIISELHKVAQGYPLQFAIKFQFRDLDTFIHPDFKERYDYSYIKRFSETRLSREQFKRLKDEADTLGFLSICTPFDERSVDLIEELGFQAIKIASCSFTDWPLLDRIAQSEKPIIASTAGAALNDIDKVVSYFTHRKKQFALMHCVAEYPTKHTNLQLNQIDLFKTRYPDITIGYSTHEDPENDDSVKVAIAKGAQILEKHIGVANDTYKVNAYSAVPAQIKKWLDAVTYTYEMCGVVRERMKFTEKEASSLRALGRGVFAKKLIKKGERIALNDVFLAIPTLEGQLIANDLSKYAEIVATKDIAEKKPVNLCEVAITDNREKIYRMVVAVKDVIKKSGILVPSRLDLEISHHYGVDRFFEYGCTLINFINREYCKKLIVVVPNQSHPEQYHQVKEETFHVLYGEVLLKLDGKEKLCKPGEMVTVEKGVKHIFSSATGAIIEEISSTHFKDDSFYTDPSIAHNKNRKTLITNWIGV